jgi:mono/diheme cytochrome c family protein
MSSSSSTDAGPALTGAVTDARPALTRTTIAFALRRIELMLRRTELMPKLALAAAAVLLCVAGPSRAADKVSFRSEVAPILLEHCVACHGAKKAEGGYRVDAFEELLKPGDTGEKPVDASAASGGEVLRRVTSADESERMPAESEPLPPEQVEVLRRWVAEGAAFDAEAPEKPLSLVIPPRQYAAPPQSYARPVPVAAVAFSPDGTKVLVGGYHEVSVWNAEDGTLVRRIANMPQRVFALAFLPDARRFVAAGGEPGRSGEVRLVDFETGNVAAILARSGDVALDVALRPGTNVLAVAAADSLIRLVDLETGADVRTIASHADWVTGVAWSDDGTRMASSSRDKSAKLYDAMGELTANYQGHGAPVRGVAFTPDGKQVLSLGADAKLHRWNVEGATKAAEVVVGEGFRVVRRDGFALVPSGDAQVRQIDLATNAVARSLAGHGDWVLSATVSRDGLRFATGALDGEVRLWNAADGAAIRAWTAKP